MPPEELLFMQPVFDNTVDELACGQVDHLRADTGQASKLTPADSAELVTSFSDGQSFEHASACTAGHALCLCKHDCQWFVRA